MTYNQGFSSFVHFWD